MSKNDDDDNKVVMWFYVYSVYKRGETFSPSSLVSRLSSPRRGISARVALSSSSSSPKKKKIKFRTSPRDRFGG